MKYIPQIMEMNKEQLRQLQLIELELLLELDRICRKNHIKYNICGGSLIGAMRHGGFIPWDDDIDVRMLRSEYNKFRKACEQDLDVQKFFLQDFKSDSKYRWGYAKLLRCDTIYVRTGQEHLKMRNGAYMDILISDGIPNNKLGAKLHDKLCFGVRKILWSPVGAKVSSKASLRTWYKLLSFIPRSIPVRVINFLANRWSVDNCSCLRSLTFPQKRGLKREWFLELAEISFEGHMVFAPADAEGWLRQEYGDYMKLPDEEKRVGHSPASYFDFSKLMGEKE